MRHHVVESRVIVSAGSIPVSDHAAQAFTFHPSCKLTNALSKAAEWDTQIDHTIGVVYSLTVDNGFLIGHKQLLFVTTRGRPNTQLSITAHHRQLT